jgi:hypothetical protein
MSAVSNKALCWQYQITQNVMHSYDLLKVAVHFQPYNQKLFSKNNPYYQKSALRSPVLDVCRTKEQNMKLFVHIRTRKIMIYIYYHYRLRETIDAQVWFRQPLLGQEVL